MTYFEQLHPWCVVRLLPDCQRVTVARFRRRNAALDYGQVLRRLVPQGLFEVVFDAAAVPLNCPNDSGQTLGCLESRRGQ
ncbi:hypothetical protein [Spirulina major]|uniref:hypothetical protein n=1 Tax=Spirulina major TaxID=270636 RepID=UPI00093449DD|nr:hypothetical protein [Spirulina major]